MIVKIKSNNPQFLNILYRSKSNFDGITILSNKCGHIIGNVVSDSEYHVFFQDTKYSYNQNMGNMLDQQSLSNPRILLDINNMLFNHLLKDVNEVLKTKNFYADDTYENIDKFPCTMEISNIFIDSNWAQDDTFIFLKYYPQITDFKKISGNQYSMIIKCNSIIETINLSSFICMMISVTNTQSPFIDEGWIRKYIRILANVKNIPFFVVYLFKVRLLFNDVLFSTFKSELETLLPELKLTFGNTHTQRLNYISHLFNEDKNDILDLGCGELKYFKKLSRKFKDTRNYFCVDTNNDYALLLDKMKKLSKFKSSFHTDIKKVRLKKKTTVICSEVIEHIGLVGAKETLEYLLTQRKIKKIILTTPNKEFNKYYLIDKRRDDHVFEFDNSEFKKFIKTVKDIDKYNVEYINVGDVFNDSVPTIGCVINRKSPIKEFVKNLIGSL